MDSEPSPVRYPRSSGKIGRRNDRNGNKCTARLASKCSRRAKSAAMRTRCFLRQPTFRSRCKPLIAFQFFSPLATEKTSPPFTPAGAELMRAFSRNFGRSFARRDIGPRIGWLRSALRSVRAATKSAKSSPWILSVNLVTGAARGRESRFPASVTSTYPRLTKLNSEASVSAKSI